METRPVYYCMLDPRWRWDLYDINPADGPDYIGTAGCAPTTAAMLAAELTGDSSITPPVMAQFAIDHGDRTPNNGTARSLFYHVGEAFGLRCQETARTDAALSCLRDGGLVVCHVGPGRWTRGGHYILLWGCDGKTVAINDPSGDTARRNRGSLKELEQCRKAYVCFWPKEESAMNESDVRAIARDEAAKAVEAARARVYTTIPEVPAWAQELVKRAVDAGILHGDERGKLHLTDDNLVNLQLMERLGLIKEGV